ncbi:MAG: SDR family oxidoreductase [Actinobacteria bacterium]|nr:SDR family oxidoreductase [Actinomycetota bacterium]
MTGVTGKAGRGVAEELARHGWKVVGTGRRAERGPAFEDGIRAEGGDATFMAGDVGRVADCERVVATALERYGRVDLLVNNAATVGDPPFVDSHELPEATWDLVVDTNLKGAFYCSSFALRPMIEQGSGVIVNISSIMAVNMGPPRMAAYTASEAGMIAMTKAMAVEYADRGIRCNVIVVGAVDGDNADIVTDALAGGDGGAARRPAARMTGADLGKVVLFLASNEARYVNGAALNVDSGASAGLLAARAMAAIGAR